MSENLICDERHHPHHLVSIMIVDSEGKTQTWRDICAYTLPNLDRLFARPDMVKYGLGYTIIPRVEIVPGPGTFIRVPLDWKPGDPND